MEHLGLLSWANSVRLTMASDPGRQLFKDQVQTHGFLFLDDYLDNIVSGGKQDPLIELVKTPGRKKAIARKPKLMSKLASVVSLEDGDENAAPANNLQRALFSVKPDKGHGDRNTNEPHTIKPDHKPPRIALTAIQPVESNTDRLLNSHAAPVHALTEQRPSLELPTTNTENNDLSIIAEDDEPSERSQPSTAGHGSQPIISPRSSVTPSTQELPPVPEAPGRKSSLDRASDISRRDSKMDIASTSIASTSVDTFHSIPLDSPAEFHTAHMEGSAASQPLEPDAMVVEENTGPLPVRPTSTPVQDHEMADTPDDNTSVAHKPTLPAAFPTLPEPMPLRKSMRPPRDPSMNAVMLGAATPGAAGKRTSWLMKAREVKMLETGKKSQIPPVPSIGSIFGSTLSVMPGIKRKSGDMLDVHHSQAVPETEERLPKVAKTAEGETAPRISKETTVEPSTTHAPPLPPPGAKPSVQRPPLEADVSQESVLGLLKKTVEGLGVRVGMGKSLGGGAAATVLAEARAAAEARLAERDRKDEEMTTAMGLAATNTSHSDSTHHGDMPSSSSTQQNDGRMSLSDLFPMENRMKEKHKAPEKVFHKATPPPAFLSKEVDTTRMSTSTTPPNSPPATRPSVFTKPPPVFVPPAPIPAANAHKTSLTKDFAFRAPSPPKFNVHTSTTLGFTPHLPSSFSPKNKATVPLTAHSTLESVQSENIFDNDDDVPAWLPSTQETDYTSAYGSQQPPTQICDEEDSWPIDEKLSAGVQWTYGASKEDSLTWSTLPSQSQRADTGPITQKSPIREERSVMEPDRSRQIPGSFHDVDMENEGEVQEDLVPRDEELEEIVLGAKSTVSLVKTQPPRSQSVMSMVSSESSQSQAGFFGQASKLFSSALGGSKKKPDVKKVLDRAAVAAKKQQEEADKKAARLKEMENRRQQAIQRKAEEEKAKALEEERKMKEDAERRKKEREEYTDKRPLKPMTSKKEDDTMKKRKLEAEKKAEIKKPAPSVLLGKSHLKSALKQPVASSSTTHGHSAHPHNPSSTATFETYKSVNTESSNMHKSKTVATQKMVIEDELSQPSQLMQSQMAARAKAQIEASKPAVPPSESIELPDINSEYSDSDDEDRVRTFDPPNWAQSPELRQTLEMQSTINPDDIFGAVRPLKMEEIFKTRTSRFRARTSSANWTGTDRLTIQEELEYARRMGFK